MHPPFEARSWRLHGPGGRLVTAFTAVDRFLDRYIFEDSTVEVLPVDR